MNAGIAKGKSTMKSTNKVATSLLAATVACLASQASAETIAKEFVGRWEPGSKCTGKHSEFQTTVTPTRYKGCKVLAAGQLEYSKAVEAKQQLVTLQCTEAATDGGKPKKYSWFTAWTLTKDPDEMFVGDVGQSGGTDYYRCK
jgi:hypothetical protein